MADTRTRTAPVDGRAARWAGQRERRRAEIVAAAIAAIGEHGPRVSTEQVAERAGISRPRLYRHFADADDLYDAVAQRIAEVLVAEMVPVLTRPTGSAREVIGRVVGTFAAWMAGHVEQYHYVVTRWVEVGPGRAQLVADVRSTIGGLLRDLLAGYLAVLGVRTRLADPLAFGLVGMVESATARWLAEPADVDLDGLVARLTDWTWGVVDATLRESGVVLDPDAPLPPLPLVEETR